MSIGYKKAMPSINFEEWWGEVGGVDDQTTVQPDIRTSYTTRVVATIAAPQAIAYSEMHMRYSKNISKTKVGMN